MAAAFAPRLSRAWRIRCRRYSRPDVIAGDNCSLSAEPRHLRAVNNLGLPSTFDQNLQPRRHDRKHVHYPSPGFSQLLLWATGVARLLLVCDKSPELRRQRGTL